MLSFYQSIESSYLHLKLGFSKLIQELDFENSFKHFLASQCDPRIVIKLSINTTAAEEEGGLNSTIKELIKDDQVESFKGLQEIVSSKKNLYDYSQSKFNGLSPLFLLLSISTTTTKKADALFLIPNLSERFSTRRFESQLFTSLGTFSRNFSFNRFSPKKGHRQSFLLFDKLFNEMENPEKRTTPATRFEDYW